MKIADARQIYYAKQQKLSEEMKKVSKQKEKAAKNSMFSEAASLELSYKEIEKVYNENRKVLESIMEQKTSRVNSEALKQQDDAINDSFDDLGKIIMVFRRMAKGDIVPPGDEKKLMEYDSKMYMMAKNMQAFEQQMRKKIKQHESLWEDEEKKTAPDDPNEIADNSEYVGSLPNIDVPEITLDSTDIEGGE